ncbi:hypothetical protein PIB30_055297 [Stylosanthes scabra]|uniref:Protein kinase domain-containing protein n=1 Tax=Stylosanthes scabra TaxID=79078 RepID=A0ABU6XJB4_9FABA|nr:hypothetical protein [Stylosanthes scabra]
MMATNINQQLFSLLLLLFLLIPLSSSQPDQFLYSGFKSVDAKNITLNDIAEIEKNGVLRLTNDTSRLMGHAFYPSPFQLKDKASGKVLSFSTSFALAIVPEYPKLGGHGLAFTIATSKDLKAHPSQYLGLLNPDDVGNFTNHLFAVEFDTVQDFEFGDINDNHVGIDINSLQSNASVNASYYLGDNGSERLQDLNLKSGKPIMVWVDYDSQKNLLSVTMSPTSSKPKRATLSFNVDLSPIFLDTMYVGFSASTGLLASSHYVLGWSFRINGPAPVLDLADLPQLPGPKKKHKSLIIGGGFGRVYKGTLPNSRTQVAVKRISHESKQGLREFISEIASIGRLRHRNLVQLLGWCRRRGDLLLVYDFMANGSLDKYLFDEPKIVLNWEQRFKIIKGVASALLYLHEGYEQVVIHRDVKASNVMLDSEMNGRLGDFGLARLYEHGANPSTTRVVGTLGYLAPELPRTGRATTSSDVFAFGALLLEVACGRRPIEPKALPEELVLVDCLWEKFKEGRILDMVDPRLNGEFDEDEILMVLKLGLICSNDNPNGRPNIRQVMRYLDGEVELPDEMRMHVGSNHEGFDEFLHSLASSSFDTGSYIGTRDMDNSFTSFGYSPQSLTQTRGETR